MAGLKSPISQVALVLRMRSEGLGLRATARVLGMHKQTVSTWEERFASMSDTLLLYGACHTFIGHLTCEGDEIYTIVGKRTDASASTGWTAVILERTTRFLLEQRCGARDQALFTTVMTSVCALIARTDGLTFLSDGERRYGNTLFALCAEALHTGTRGRPAQTLPPAVHVRIKNKGDQRHRRGPKRQKYQAPWREHPDNTTTVPDADIHAEHVEARNAAMRRRNSAFRRRTNTYAKTTNGLQRTLDVDRLIHNYVRTHWTTKQVPAVALGILAEPLSIEDILSMRKAA